MKLKNKVGPGAYTIHEYLGKEGAHSTIAAKLNDNFQEKESRNKPGPGSYDHSHTVSSTLKALPSYKIGTSKRSESIPKDRFISPEPGAYDPTINFTKTSAASFGFGTGKR